MIVSEKIIKNFKEELILEDEKVRLSDGMCFGEWGLLFNLPRAASAYSLEDTHILHIDKEFFKYCFFKNIYKSISEKKKFFLKRLPFLGGSNKISDFLKNVNPIVIIKLFILLTI